MDRHHVEPVEEIAAEALGGDGRLEIAVGGGEDPDINRNRVPSADALDLAIFQQPEELGLDGERDIADLIEEQGAAVGLLDLADPALDGAGEGAPLETEELTFEQGLRDGDTVDDDKRRIHSGRVLVNRAGDQFLAGAGGASDENGGVGGSDPADGLGDLLNWF